MATPWNCRMVETGSAKKIRVSVDGSLKSIVEKA
jgi:hypothetical protein